jgi:hypothetical protein
MIYFGHFGETDMCAISFTFSWLRKRRIMQSQKVRKSTPGNTGFTMLTKRMLDAGDRRGKNG